MVRPSAPIVDEKVPAGHPVPEAVTEMIWMEVARGRVAALVIVEKKGRSQLESFMMVLGFFL
jgi:hypothetical protein